MPLRQLHLVCLIAGGLIFPAAARAQSLAPEDSAVLPPPLSITQRYVPAAKNRPRAPLTLLVDDSTAVAAAGTAVQPAPRQPAMAEEVGDRPAIAALAPGRMAITVSTTIPTAGQRDPPGAVLFQNGRPLPSLRR